MEEIRYIPLGRYNRRDVTASRSSLPDGTLVECMNARPILADVDGVGPHSPMLEYERVGDPVRILPGLNGVIWAAVHTRTRPDDPASEGAAASKKRLIVLRTNALRVIDFEEGSPTYGTVIANYGLGTQDANRTASLVPMASICLVAIPGFPVMVVRDDTIEELSGVPLIDPSEMLSNIFSQNLEPGDKGLPPGTYIGRFALILNDGTAGPLGPAFRYLLRPRAQGGQYIPLAPLRIMFGVTPSQLSLSSFWIKRTRGVALYVSYVPHKLGDDPVPSSTLDVDVFSPIAPGYGGPFYKAWSVMWKDDSLPPNSTRLLEGTLDDLVSGEVAGEDSLSYLGVYANTACALNGRAILGGVSWNYPNPIRRGVTSGFQRWGRLRIDIETYSGTIRRFSEPVLVTNPTVIGDQSEYGQGERVTYADRRAKKVVFYLQQSAGIWAECGFLDMDAPDTANIAYSVGSIVVNTIPSGAPTITDAEISAINADELDTSPHRITATEVYNPFYIRADRVTYAGDGDEDAIQRLLPVGYAPSEGQFGSFGIVVFGSASTRLLRTSDAQGGPLFASVDLVSMGRGASKPWSVCALGAGAVSAAHDGIRFFDPYPSADVISEPMHDVAFVEGLQDCALGWYQHKDGDELWVTLRNPPAGQLLDTIFVYSFAAGAWFWMTGMRRGFFTDETPGGVKLYGIGRSGELWEEEATVIPGNRSMVLETAPMNLGAPSMPKRIREVRVRSRGIHTMMFNVAERVIVNGSRVNDVLGTFQNVQGIDSPVLMIRKRSAVQPSVRIVAESVPGQRVQGLDVRYEIRRSRRLRPGEAFSQE